ncbi:hypothetical protein NCAS_0E03430 [Naumovozyma castellii]|uniref:Protein BIG1 n=1 Tax=Naumovozyma castellii TaxID=27288 RepID=G0VFZ4_NAUCA|nr:hypothetical protein NCAS_0E03430 [Naumovozyma castellii CBS 4309]CCC70413.1 hypothetical protein NCAS_0E03430 [Naumovozyma castellii CBS 4309]
MLFRTSTFAIFFLLTATIPSLVGSIWRNNFDRVSGKLMEMYEANTCVRFLQGGYSTDSLVDAQSSFNSLSQQLKDVKEKYTEQPAYLEVLSMVLKMKVKAFEGIPPLKRSATVDMKLLSRALSFALKFNPDSDADDGYSIKIRNHGVKNDGPADIYVAHTLASLTESNFQAADKDPVSRFEGHKKLYQEGAKTFEFMALIFGACIGLPGIMCQLFMIFGVGQLVRFFIHLIKFSFDLEIHP